MAFWHSKDPLDMQFRKVQRMQKLLNTYRRKLRFSTKETRDKYVKQITEIWSELRNELLDENHPVEYIFENAEKAGPLIANLETYDEKTIDAARTYVYNLRRLLQFREKQA